MPSGPKAPVARQLEVYPSDPGITEELRSKKAQFAYEMAMSHRTVLMEYTKDKNIKECQSEVEKARSDELADEGDLGIGGGQRNETGARTQSQAEVSALEEQR